MKKFCGILFLYTILLPNTLLGLPLKVHHRQRHYPKHLRKLCTLPIWYGKTHIYHSKICTIIKSIDSMTTTESSTTTILPTVSSIMSKTTLKVPMEELRKGHKKKTCVMKFTPHYRSRSFAFVPKFHCFWVDSENDNNLLPTVKSTSTPSVTTTKSTNEVYSFLRL